MKTEYILTAAAKAELADIDRQIEMLCRRTVEIYALSPCRYVTETQEEFEQVERYKRYLCDGIINKNAIAKIIFEKGDDKGE